MEVKASKYKCTFPLSYLHSDVQHDCVKAGGFLQRGFSHGVGQSVFVLVFFYSCRLSD